MICDDAHINEQCRAEFVFICRLSLFVSLEGPHPIEIPTAVGVDKRKQKEKRFFLLHIFWN